MKIEIIQKGKDQVLFCNEEQLILFEGREGCTDQIEMIREGAFHWVRTTETAAEKMEMKLRTSYDADFYMVPGANYNGNGFGTFCEYEGDRYDGIPWKYGWQRATVASMTMSQGATDAAGAAQMAVSLFGLPNDCSGCSVYREEGRMVHAIFWPEEEAPKSLKLYRFDPPFCEAMEPRSRFEAWVVIEQVEAEPKAAKQADTEQNADFSAPLCKKLGYRNALDLAWDLNQAERAEVWTPEAIFRFGTEYAKILYTEEEDGFCGFNIGLAWEDGQWKKRRSNKYEIGWCGQNALLANALLYYSMQENALGAAEKEELRRIGFRVLDSWIEKAYLPIGVMHTYYDPGQIRYLEACNLGTAGLEYFRAFDLAGALGCVKPEYEKAAYDICEFALRVQHEDGSFAKCWNADGTEAICEGTVGAFLVMPLLEGYARSRKECYLQAARRALEHYFYYLHRDGFTTAGALDIFSIDKESAIPLLKSTLKMYHITKEEQWKRWACDAAWYLSTWQCAFSLSFDEDTMLKKTGYDTFGGTIVSTVHMGMDSFALCYVADLYELYEITQETRWLSRAKAAWRNGCQNLSDGTLVVDGKLRPIGSQDESFGATRQDHRMGNGSQWLVAWPGAFRMDILMRLKDTKFF